jgi:hypothetical protein
VAQGLGHGDRFAGNETFTPPSPGGHRRNGPRTDTSDMEITARLVFIAAVTCYLLGRVFSGDPSHPELVVYGITSAFGLEFLIAQWRTLWAPT